MSDILDQALARSARAPSASRSVPDTQARSDMGGRS